MGKRKAIIVIALLLGVLLTLVLYYFSQKSTDSYFGIVVPHHDMVRSYRVAFLERVAKVNDPKTVVLISPDHFDTNRFPITASTKVWDFNSGSVYPNLALIDALSIEKDAGDFKNEHGITTVLVDIGTFFPKAKVVPVMISTRAKIEDIESFIDRLYSNCGDCLLVASVDFSHSFQVDVASLHDVVTLRSLYQLDSESLYHRAEVDSPGSLLALAYWANKHKAKRFDLFSQTNSGLLNKTSVGEMTTHIIGGYRVGDKVDDLDNDLTMMFGGDVMFARGVSDLYDTEPAFALTKNLGDRTFWGVDLSVVNLEGVFKETGEVRDGWNSYPPVFRFEPKFIKALQAASIDVVSLSNNHNKDGRGGEYEYTKHILNSQKVRPLESIDKTKAPIIKEVGNTKVALFGYSLFEKSEDIAPLITEYKNAGYRVVIYVHFGSEYDIKPTVDQVNAAKQFIDAGASLVVGSHPHVLQPVDVYKGVPIVYSLGNLLFDQKQNGTEIGALLGVRFNSKGVALFLVPISTYLGPKFINKDLSPLLQNWEDYLVSASSSKYFFPYN